MKLDTLMMGHLCPHLHCHVYPQYEHDDPRKLIDIQEDDVRLTEAGTNDRIAQVRLQLGTEMLVGRLPGGCSKLQAPAPKVR